MPSMNVKITQKYISSLFNTNQLCIEYLQTNTFTAHGKAYLVAPLYCAANSLLDLHTRRLLRKNETLVSANAKLTGQLEELKRQTEKFEKTLTIDVTVKKKEGNP